MASSFEQLIFEIIATDKNASAAFDKFRHSVDQSSRSMDDNTKSVDKNAKSIDNLGERLGASLKNLGTFSGPTGMGALIAAGAVLSPVLVTLGTGLAGFGLAAYGAVAPVLKAAQATGGLRANMAKLDPEQQQLARSVLALGKQYDTFQKQLQPEVLSVFGKGIQIAGHLMHDLQPIAKQTGIALGSLLDRIDAEFQSKTWQSFFTWMAANVGPDIKLVGTAFVNLQATLPPLLRLLNPVAVDFLAIVDAGTKLIQKASEVGNASTQTGHKMGALQQVTTALRLALFAPGVGLYHALKLVGIIGPDTAKGIKGTGDAAAGASYHVGTLADAVNNLNKAETNSLNTQLAYSNALITAGNDAQALRQALHASSGQVGLHTAAQRASFSAANQYISDLENAALQAVASGKGAKGAAAAIQAGIPILTQAARHNHALWLEVQTLKGWLDKLRLEKPIQEKINVLGLGKWSATAATHAIAQGPGPFAAGGRITAGTTSTADDVLIRASRNETVLSAAHSAILAPLLARIGVPGYAAGGIVGSYSGSAGGLKPWGTHDMNVAAGQILSGIGNAMAQAFRNAQSSFGGGFSGGAVGGSAAANRAIAMRMFPWPSSMFPSFDYVEMREAGYSLTAQNPSSGAYGMAQFINGPGEYAQWGGNATTAGGQLTGMFNYIRSRYGNPVAAAAHEASFNWYDRGGWLPPGPSLAYNGTGVPERVLAPGRGRGPVMVVENLHVREAADVDLLARRLAFLDA